MSKRPRDCTERTSEPVRYFRSAEKALERLKERCGDANLEAEFRASLRAFPTAARKRKNGAKGDEHDDVCTCCNKGGTLMCCDSCSNAFHVACVRPTIKGVPRGKWSCAFCLHEKGNTTMAGHVADMHSMLPGSRSAVQDPVNNSPLCAAISGGNANGGGTGTIPESEYTIVRSGRRFTLMQTARGRTSEVERFEHLKGALEELVALQRQRQRKRSNSLGSPSKAGKRGPGRPRKDSLTKSRHDTCSIEDQPDWLWCVCCLDDPNISLCAFCGCRKCLSKSDSDNIILCDGCDVEYHIYCLDPPMESVPTETWYCQTCEAERSVLSDNEEEGEAETAQGGGQKKVAGSSSKRKKGSKRKAEAAVVDAVEGATEESDGKSSAKGLPGRPRSSSTGSTGSGRGPGRPKGSGSKQRARQVQLALNADRESPAGTLYDNDCTISLHSPVSATSDSHVSPQLAPQISCLYRPGVSADLQCVKEVTVALQVGIDKHSPALLGPLDLAMLALFREWGSLDDLQAARQMLLTQRHKVMARLDDLHPGVLAGRQVELDAARAALEVLAGGGRDGNGDGAGVDGDDGYTGTMADSCADADMPLPVTSSRAMTVCAGDTSAIMEAMDAAATAMEEGAPATTAAEAAPTPAPRGTCG